MLQEWKCENLGKINICCILKVKIVTIDVLEINGGIQIDLKKFQNKGVYHA